MATYVISDIHGEYELFIKLLEKIRFTSADTLYVLGDVIDRGPHPIKALLKLMEMPNAVCLVGNHEVMALKCLKFLRQEITESSIEKIDEKLLDNLATWQYNGAETTISEFRRLDEETQLDVLDFMEDFLVYETLTIEGKNYLLVHGGLGNFSPEKDIEDYSLHDIVWERPDYGRQYLSGNRTHSNPANCRKRETRIHLSGEKSYRNRLWSVQSKWKACCNLPGKWRRDLCR